LIAVKRYQIPSNIQCSKVWIENTTNAFAVPTNKVYHGATLVTSELLNKQDSVDVATSLYIHNIIITTEGTGSKIRLKYTEKKLKQGNQIMDKSKGYKIISIRSIRLFVELEMNC